MQAFMAPDAQPASLLLEITTASDFNAPLIANLVIAKPPAAERQIGKPMTKNIRKSLSNQTRSARKLIGLRGGLPGSVEVPMDIDRPSEHGS